MLYDGQTLFGVSVAEKGVLWLRMIAEGPPGHGSTPDPRDAPARLMRALERIGNRRPAVDLHAPMRELLARAGEAGGGMKGSILRSPVLQRALVVPKLLDNPLAAATIIDTVHVTGFGGAEEPNVVPSEVWAVLDCRLLPGHDPEALLAELRDLVDDDAIRFEILDTMDANQSPSDDPLFDAVHRVLMRHHRDVAVGPVVSVGSTDSQIFRPLGVHAYGIAPFRVTTAEAATMHGDDERIAVAQLRAGLRDLFGIVVEFAADPTGRPGAAAHFPRLRLPAAPPDARSED